MSLTRKMLKGMGIEEEKIDSIIDAHTETVEALKLEKSNADAEVEKYKEFERKFNDLVKENESNSDWKTKYENLKAEYDGFKVDIDNEKITAKKTDAYKKLLSECKIDSSTHSACVNASLSDIEKIVFDDNGEISNADEIKEAINSKWSGFAVNTSIVGANPAKNNGNSQITKADIMKISDDVERQKAIAQNLNLFKGG